MNNTIPEVLGQDFFKKHKSVFALAKKNGVAICGGVAAAICRGNKNYVPRDIDFVCGSKDSLVNFIAGINKLLLSYPCHYRIFVNSKNKFCPKTAQAHFRVTSSFWIPLCVFLIPEDKFHVFRGKHGTIIQRISDVQEAADDLQKVDGKQRFAATEHDIDLAERYGELPENPFFDSEDKGSSCKQPK